MQGVNSGGLWTENRAARRGSAVRRWLRARSISVLLDNGFLIWGEIGIEGDGSELGESGDFAILMEESEILLILRGGNGISEEFEDFLETPAAAAAILVCEGEAMIVRVSTFRKKMMGFRVQIFFL